jgi:hypothetical protein
MKRMKANCWMTVPSELTWMRCCVLLNVGQATFMHYSLTHGFCYIDTLLPKVVVAVANSFLILSGTGAKH